MVEKILVRVDRTVPHNHSQNTVSTVYSAQDPELTTTHHSGDGLASLLGFDQVSAYFLISSNGLLHPEFPSRSSLQP